MMAAPLRRCAFIGWIALWSVVNYSQLCGQSATLPQMIGNTSCATSTCHGGVTGRGSPWNSSANQFQAHDPHTRAGQVLNEPLSKQIVQMLEPNAAFEDVLQRRCVSCHATVDAELVKSPQPIAWNVVLQGVSCESCHGPASRWVEAHVLTSWSGSDRFAKETGMRDTEDWMTRTLTCVRCHIGSRSEDGLVRDMNHDMIAAGHPALRFDMSAHFSRLPKHWEEGKKPQGSEKPSIMPGLIERHQASKLLSAWTAAKLSTERSKAVEEDPTAVWPELADHDCFACHHIISISPEQRAARRLGRPEWNPWYVRGSTFAQVDNVLGHDEQLAIIQRISQEALNEARRRINQPIAASEHLQGLLKNFIEEPDWYSASHYYLDAAVALEAFVQTGNAPKAGSDRLQQSLRQYAEQFLAFPQTKTGFMQSPRDFNIAKLRQWESFIYPQKNPKSP